MAIFLIALATLSTYFGVKKEMQARYDKVLKELEEQREKDGGVFMSNDQKAEMEMKAMELVHVKKELKDLTDLFDLKSAESEKLKENLDDTIQQLEEKSLVLAKTQEEKEVQEYLVSRHQEDRVKNEAMESNMIEVADQQYSNLQKLHDVRDRKSKVEQHNIQVSGVYQKDSSKRFDKMYRNQEEEMDISNKFCSSARLQREEIVNIFESAGHTTVDNVAAMDASVKEKVTKIDSLAAARMHSEQTFLSKTLKNAQANKDDETSKHQNFLSSSLNAAQETESRIMRRQNDQDGFIAQIREFEEKSQSDDISYAKKREELNIATNEKQNEHFSVMEQFIQETKRELQTLKEEEAINNENRERQREMLKILQKSMEASEIVDQGLKQKIARVEEKLNEVSNEKRKCRKIGEAAIKTQAEIEVARRTEKEEADVRFKERVNGFQEQMAALSKDDLKRVDSGKEEVRSFIEGCQMRAQSQYEQTEVEFRERSDEVPKVLVGQQEITRDIVKLTSNSRGKIESLTESSVSKAREWSENASKDTEETCNSIATLGANNLEVIDEARSAERKFFNEENKRDRPSGSTPARPEEKRYPRQPLNFTPDEDRTRRYRSGRDLGAAMRLKIDEDEDESENDSLISASTNMTESRRTSNEIDPVFKDEPELGYASDRENSDPKFVKPDHANSNSKLRMPKVYTSSTSSNVSTRSRSSSRNRNVLGSTN